MGQIITFYSYKGGVGRTMALANVAVLLGKWGYKVLIVDWDLDAPGLEYFYKDYLIVESPYLFNWDSVPGNDNDNLLKYLKEDLDINQLDNANIIKTDDQTIHISTDDKSVQIKLNGNKEKAYLKISDGQTCNLRVKEENGKFNIYEPIQYRRGIIDILDDVINNGVEKKSKWRDYLLNICLPGIRNNNLQLLTAGRKDYKYFSKVRNLNLNTFYGEKNGGNFIETLRNEWKTDYDFVLVDSRTGITDIGGICSIQLPDMLVLLFTTAEQSLDGIIDVAKRAKRGRQKLPIERMGLLLLPIPSKFDTQKEYIISREWLDRFAIELSELYDDWLPNFVKKRSLLEITKIPYIPYFSFGEKLPVLEQGTKDPAGLGYAYENLAALIARNLGSVEQFENNRDEYIISAQKLETNGKNTVFINYSHKDEAWKDKLVTHLSKLQNEGLLDVWDDRRIGSGEDWYKEIGHSIAKASVIVLLISADYLTSNFIMSDQVPRLLERREKEGLRIIPVIIRPCSWQRIEWLSQLQALPREGRSISGGDVSKIDADMAAIAEEIADIMESGVILEKDQNRKISLAKLPSTSPELFGREKELKFLDEAWENPKINIVSLVAWGGVGKTALINSWLSKMSDEHYRGAECIYGWSFYSQGASEKQASSDLFIASSLAWFGDPDPNKGTPWEKGKRLADLIKKKRTLLVLDGLEPLQNSPGENQGKIKDPALQCLLRELAINNSGLCIITTRLEVDDIKDFVGKTVQKIPLDSLSPEAGAQFLQFLGTKGTFDELKHAVMEFDGHALALSLLGRYIAIVYQGDIRQRDKIARLTDEQKQGVHTKRVIESYEKWFEGKPELNILKIMGLFDRSADGGAIKAVIADPPIKGLTSELGELSYERWQYALNNLREAKLLIKENQHRQDVLDCHPLVREYFGAKLKSSNPAAWKEAHTRLYVYYKSHAKEFPDTIEEMAPLYLSVAHGCQAGRHQETMDDVYWRRILRGEEQFSWKKLGIFGAELAAISNFFEIPWSRPASGLNENFKAFILNAAGFCLRVLGRLSEASQPLQTGLEADIAKKDWKNGAISACNLSELFLTMGDIAQAQEYAKQSVDLADKSGDAVNRMSSLTVLAYALYLGGRISEAENLFRKTEEVKTQYQSGYPFLYSLQGFQYCDLLLSQGKYEEVLSRANRTSVKSIM